jgi:hypothetical protein
MPLRSWLQILVRSVCDLNSFSTVATGNGLRAAGGGRPVFFWGVSLQHTPPPKKNTENGVCTDALKKTNRHFHAQPASASNIEPRAS